MAPTNHRQTVRLVPHCAKNGAPAPDDIEAEPIDTGPCRIESFCVTQTAYRVFMTSAIGSPQAYDGLVSLLLNADEEDVIEIIINSIGGDLATGVQIINAIRNCKATVVTTIGAEAYSMGALIFLAGHEKRIDGNVILMLHDFSGDSHGKGNEQHKGLTATRAWFSEIVQDICEGFLSESEITALIDGRDIWMTTNEIIRRLQAMQEHLEVKEKAREKREAHRRSAPRRAAAVPAE